ncbi:hypothetical protein BDW71DRAFT_185572 [Aspergillus fruticulosus]
MSASPAGPQFIVAVSLLFNYITQLSALNYDPRLSHSAQRYATQPPPSKSPQSSRDTSGPVLIPPTLAPCRTLHPCGGGNSPRDAAETGSVECFPFTTEMDSVLGEVHILSGHGCRQGCAVTRGWLGGDILDSRGDLPAAA